MASGPGSGHFLIAYYLQDSSLDQRVIQDSFLSLHHCEISVIIWGVKNATKERRAEKNPSGLEKYTFVSFLERIGNLGGQK